MGQIENLTGKAVIAGTLTAEPFEVKGLEGRFCYLESESQRLETSRDQKTGKTTHNWVRTGITYQYGGDPRVFGLPIDFSVLEVSGVELLDTGRISKAQRNERRGIREGEVPVVLLAQLEEGNLTSGKLFVNQDMETALEDSASVVWFPIIGLVIWLGGCGFVILSMWLTRKMEGQ